MLVLGELGVSLAPILGAAGVVGLAIGFGAQSLVKDYFTGFFILFEDQIRTGDVVTIAKISGAVEDITLRHVRLRDYDGNVHFIPNSLITTVTNMSRGFAHAVMDVGVAYRENVDEVMAEMHEVGRAMRADPAFRKLIVDDLEMAGVERLDQSAVVIRCRIKVAPLQQRTVRREYLRRVKSAFDAHGIEIPYPTSPSTPASTRRARHRTCRCGWYAEPTAPPSCCRADKRRASPPGPAAPRRRSGPATAPHADAAGAPHARRPRRSPASR